MGLAIGLAVFYVIGLPILFRLLAFAHKRLVTNRRLEKAGNNQSAIKKVKPPIWGTWKERLSYLLKEDRSVMQFGRKKDGQAPEGGLTHRQFFFILWGVGLILAVLPAFISHWELLGVSVLIFFVDLFIGMSLVKPVLEARKNVLTRMFEIARTKLGQSAEYTDAPGQVIRVLEWDQQVKPLKVEFDVPTAFNGEMGEDSFLKQFNQIFGQETAWVPSDDEETGKPGWDYGKGVVTIHAVPPLPQRANWDEHYINSEGIAWSFFPIALGVEGGVELPNPATGEMENVLGFDLSGEQDKVGKAAGLKVSPHITTSPMVFVGGGTGGGKSLGSSTKVLTRHKKK